MSQENVVYLVYFEYHHAFNLSITKVPKHTKLWPMHLATTAVGLGPLIQFLVLNCKKSPKIQEPE